MNHRPLRSAIALSLGALIAFAGTAAADTARADGNVSTPVVEAVVTLDPFAPGEVRSVDVGIVLTCTGTSHVDPGQTVTAIIDSWISPEDGAVMSATDGTVGPAPADWTPDGVACPLPARMFYTGTPSVVTLRAPTKLGTGYRFSLMYHRTIQPFGADDPGAIRQLTAIEILLDVVANPHTPDRRVRRNRGGRHDRRLDGRLGRTGRHRRRGRPRSDPDLHPGRRDGAPPGHHGCHLLGD